VTELERAAEAWIEPYWNAEHLRRARDWLLVLDPAAGEAARIAALTHDIERHFPGGPSNSLDDPPDEPTYRRLHSERSAGFVTGWLREQGAGEALVAEVEALVLLHENGGTPEADLVQAADSLSFLEINATLVEGWVREGRCTAERGAAQLQWMYDRMQVARADELGRPLLEAAIARL